MSLGKEQDEVPQSSSGPTLFVRWVLGFPKQKVQFMNDKTICYPCGDFIVFLNIESKKKIILQCMNGVVGVMATNIPYRVVAFSDRKLRPLIYIYSFPELARQVKLKGNVLLDYTILSFSYCGNYLASYSSLPEFELAIWDWKTGVILCKKTQPGTDVNQITFNPMNSRQLCLSSTSAVTLWTIERCNQEHFLKSKLVKLPLEDGTYVNELDNVFPQSLPKDPIYGPVLPLSAIAGLVDKEAEKFKPRDDLSAVIHPTVHCWTPTNDLYIGCEEGLILMFNGESSQVTKLNIIEESLKNRTLMAPMTMVYQKGGMLTSGLDGFIYSCTIKDFNCTVKDFLEIEEALQYMTFSPNYQTLLLQTSKGCIYTYTLGTNQDLNKIIDSCNDKFHSVDFITSGNEFFLTLSSLGEVCVWNLEDASYVSRICLNTPTKVLVCSPSSLSAAVGTATGSVQFLDLRKVYSLQVIHKVFLSRASVDHLLYDQQGTYLLAGTSEGHIFVINAKPSSFFKVLGFIEVTENILQISTVALLETDIVEVMVMSLLPNKRTRVETFILPRILPQVSAGLVDERGKMSKELIHPFLYEIDHVLCSAVLDFKSHRLYGFCADVPYICSYELPEIEHTGILILKPYQKKPSQHYGSGVLSLSPHGLWLLSVAKCGVLCIRDIQTLSLVHHLLSKGSVVYATTDRSLTWQDSRVGLAILPNNEETFARYRSHSHQSRGIQSVKMSLDGQYILVNGMNDGTLVCLRWRRLGGSLSSDVMDYYGRHLKFLETSMEEENDCLDMSQEERSDSLEALPRNLSSTESSQDEEPLQFREVEELPWLEQKRQEAIQREVKVFSSKRKEIKKRIKVLAQTVQNMMGENDTMESISKLEQQEFALDLEQLERLHQQSGEEVLKVRKDVEMRNLSKKYLAGLIKEECWNSMAVKGRSLKCFHGPCVVENFPMKARTQEELTELKRVIQQKKTENECLKVRKEIIEAQSSVILVKKHHEEEDEEEDEEKFKKRDQNLPNYLLGSMCTDFGVDVSLLSSQLELHGREEKISQIILLKDIIYNVKSAFNKEFNAAFTQKELEIIRVKERNVRIQEIILDLELDEAVWTPTFDDTEKPERILVVDSSEISAQKHISPWQRARAELSAVHEAELLLQNTVLETRRQALMDMMGGVLEMKKEDILRMVIPQPDFMVKPDVLWSEEERKQFKDYEKKVKELNEERDKYRKSLEAELKKLQNSIQESTQNFDESLKRLFDRRVKAEMVVNQEELKINNLLFSLMLNEEMYSREEYLNNYLLRKQEEKSQTSEAVLKAKEELDVYKEQYDNLVAEDKVLDRSFKKEFSDVSSHHVEILYKLFKRRPRIHKLKPQQEIITNNPFDDRSGTGKSTQDTFALLMKAMDELDNFNNMPEGLEPMVWSHFCVIRRAKVENEQKVKQKAAGLVEITAFLRKRTEEDEKVQQEIEKVYHELILLQEEKVKHQLNLTIQILLKQGQVELENFQFLMEYSDAILINKHIIEDLNSVIRTQGQKKVASMMESKDFHKGIFQIEWEHKKMEMEIKDLNQKAWDIQMLFFSRERQRYLNEPNYESLIAYQIGIMEQTINALDKTHKKNVENCKKILKKLGNFSNQKDIANYQLSCNLREELVAVSERKDICNAMGATLTFEKIAKERYENMILQQKLTHISKEQAEQISVLQAEVERLRLRTFPALLQM